jgi:riboflavin biosynthesis pyrimidine reductase
VVVSGGRLDLTRAIFRTRGKRILIVTVQAGIDLLEASAAGSLASTEVRSLEGSIISPASVLELLRTEFGVSLLLREGAASPFGRFLADGCLDELFLTIAPQVAGRDMQPLRPGFIAGQTAGLITGLTILHSMCEALKTQSGRTPLRPLMRFGWHF